jgi:c-di-GMP-binding flagellar brake protein YcgR
MKENLDGERRIHPRVRFIDRIEVSMLPSETNKTHHKTQFCQCRDISGGGLSFYSAHPCPRDTVVRLSILVDNKDETDIDQDTCLDVMAKIIWCKKLEEKSYLAGAQFLNIYDEDFNRLIDYVQEQLVVEESMELETNKA